MSPFSYIDKFFSEENTSLMVTVWHYLYIQSPGIICIYIHLLYTGHQRNAQGLSAEPH